MNAGTCGAPARWWEAMPDGRVRCMLCPRECQLRDGQRGFCFSRQASNGTLWLTAYGQPVGLADDPIEKKPLHHFLPGSRILSFGTLGCNLGCRCCQNWSLSHPQTIEHGAAITSPEAIARAAVQSGCRSVAFTYNEPIIFAEYAMDCARAAHDLGLKTVAVTAGYIHPKPRAEFFARMDAANVDLKAFSDDFYREQCGGRLQPVLDCLQWIRRESAVWLEITTLLIPGLNDTPDELARLCEWLLANLGDETPLHFTAFHPAYKLKDRAVTPAATLRHARQLALTSGLRHVYIGNCHDQEGQSTDCTQCGQRLIERNWHRVTQCGLTSPGNCPTCGHRLAGYFASG